MARVLLKKSPKPKVWSLKEFYQKRNKLLFLRETGGLGDILMHRMIFEDVKKIMPESEIIFACPKKYHDAVNDHPYIDEILDSSEVNHLDYVIAYNTTTACSRYELRMAPLSGAHRSDIWANHCGVELTTHDMHINLTNEEKEYGKSLIQRIRGDNIGPSVALCPVSAMRNKNFTKEQLKWIVDDIQSRGGFLFALHNHPVEDLKDIITVFADKGKPLGIRRWMSVMWAVDYVVTVDTASFHLAGGLKKPMTAMFTFADGDVYGKYYEAELVQKHRKNGDWDCGPCYNWSNCPKTNQAIKPCLTEVTEEMLLDGIDRMFKRWPMKLEKIE